MKQKLELKPCPFCGGEAEICVAHWDFENDCPVNGSGYGVECKDCLTSTDEYETQEKAAQAWNRRSGNETD